jgi:hypothetical protein
MLSPRDVLSLVREAQGGVAGTRPLVVSGPGSAEVAAALREQGEGDLVVVEGDLDRAAALVRVVAADTPSEDDVAALRRGTRAGIPVIALARGGATQLPYVLALDLIAWPPGTPVPLEEIGGRLVRGVGTSEADALAAGLPSLRGPVVERQARDTALIAAVLAFARRGRMPTSPAITLLQARLLRRIEVANGVRPPVDPQAAVLKAGPELASALATGIACRRLVRSLPVRSRVIDAAVAYGGTLALARVTETLLRRR